MFVRLPLGAKLAKFRFVSVDPPGEVYVLLHERDPLGVYGAEVCVL